MNCLKCDKEFLSEGRYVKKYCSRKCANSRISTEEKRQKQSISSKKFYKDHPEVRARLSESSKRNAPKVINVMELDWDEMAWESKRIRIILEQDMKCIKCHNDKWLCEPITFEIDHIDGNKKNNNRENLEGLCPNCHSQTPTWRGRNNSRKQSVRNEKILKIKELYFLGVEVARSPDKRKELDRYQ